jgi:S-methylmethionine-dependent homocysteine/selenocysteine methylase
MAGTGEVIILDGGMGRQLARMGAPFRLPEWSALALIEAPEFVGRAHAAFIDSGAQVITTNTYGLAPSRIGEARFGTEGASLAALAGRLARNAADQAGRRVLVAGSLPPLFETYRPETFDEARAMEILPTLVESLEQYVDLWLIETQSSTAESAAALEATRHTGLPAWVSYTLRDEAGRTSPAELRSGESVEEAVAVDLGRGIQAVLFNCSQPEVMNAAVQAAGYAMTRSRFSAVPIGVYANAFMPEPRSDAPYAGISRMRDDLGPAQYLQWASQWVRSGATIIGGCCGVGPEHIAALRDHFRTAEPAQ